MLIIICQVGRNLSDKEKSKIKSYIEAPATKSVKIEQIK